MTRLNLDALFRAGALALLAGCERKTPSDAQTPANADPIATSASAKESISPNEARPQPKTDKVQISGGRFMMGNKDEVDATPHEIVISPFLMDKHLVTQEQY